MRYKLQFELENEKLPVDYRKSILSFIKLSLEQYSKEHYNKLYEKGSIVIKPYTFAVFLKDAKFDMDTVFIESKTMEISISIYDYEIAIVLYNAFNNQKLKKFPLNQNFCVLKNIVMLFEKNINTDVINIKLISPLVVRKRVDKKDMYYSFEHNEFLNTIRINIKEQLSITDLPKELVDDINIEPLLPKKIIVKYYEKKIEASIGTFRLSGDKRLLEFLYKSGIGSKHSSGFGMFDII